MSSVSSEAGQRPKRILIVEDDDDARDVLAELIDALGHHALPAATAGEALRHAEQSSVDLALIDLGLPGTDGYEVARQIRGTAAGGRIQLVALTGYSDERSRLIAAEAGFDDFIVKPAHAHALEALVNARPPL